MQKQSKHIIAYTVFLMALQRGFKYLQLEITKPSYVQQ